MTALDISIIAVSGCLSYAAIDWFAARLRFRDWQLRANVLAAIDILRNDEPYGVRIRIATEESLGRPVSYGALYVALERLEEAGWISHTDGAPLVERDGRARRYYFLTRPLEGYAKDAN